MQLKKTMNPCEDILDIDFDPDFLIRLLGKLSLDSIPNDVTETLQELENRSLVNVCSGEGAVSQSLWDDLTEIDQSELVLGAPASSKLCEECKNDYLCESRIACIDQTENSSNIPKYSPENSNKGDLSYMNIKSDCDTDKLLTFLPKHTEQSVKSKLCKSNPTSTIGSELQPLVKKKESKKIKKVKAGGKSSICEHKQDFMPSSSCSTSLKDLHSVFDQKGKVFDIQLCDLNTECDFNSTNELSCNEGASAEFQSDFAHTAKYKQPSELSLFLLEGHNDSFEKSSNIPDSGYDTSSCSSAVSPCSLTNAETYFEDDELSSIVAAIVEAENAMPPSETGFVGAPIPTLKDAKDPEQHKEKLIVFLKEPLTSETTLSSNSSDAENSSPSKWEGITKSSLKCPTSRTKMFKKSPTKIKDWKLGCDFKFASRNKNGCYYVFTRGKSEQNKILKQIQEDYSQSKLKVIQYVDKNLKRTASDDYQNKKRRKIWICKEETVQ